MARGGIVNRNLLMSFAMSLLALLLGLLATTASAQEPSTAGFITIDCGWNGDSNYTNMDNGLVYSTDEPYTYTGVNMKVSPDTNLTDKAAFYATVRSFPDGIRNCYTLGPVQRGSKYRVKAEFYYLNHDGLNRPPTFDIYLGVNFWETIQSVSFTRAEIITIVDTDNLEVCLVKTGAGAPFISELDLRPLPFSLYNMVNDSSTSVLFNDVRTNYGGKGQIRFPYDIYDRGWFPWSSRNSISTTKSVNLLASDRFPVPQAVIRTASEAYNVSESINTSTTSTFNRADQAAFMYMYFAELRELGNNETREFNIYADDELVFGPFRPKFLQQYVYYTPMPGRPGQVRYSIRATANSTLPPIINAEETFIHVKMPLLPTNSNEVKAIMGLKKQLSVSRNWEGDPCVPRKFIWTGLMCGYDNTKYSTITSLDLSQSRFRGRIPLSIANLTSLTSLDLSYNYFNGEIPEFFGDLSALQFLNLEGNNLSGTIPMAIYERWKNETLVLRINDNPYLCSTSDLCNAKESKKKRNIILVVVAALAAALIFVVVFITVWILKREKMPKNGVQVELNITNQQRDFAEGRQFSVAEVTVITKNFSQPVGRGNSGTVYRGNLDNGTQVAVKVLFKSFHGERQFKAEAELLTRVHHRYLISLLGFCVENLALVYEFAPLGSLADHLSGDSAHRNILNWGVRVQIALETAKGLDYLHNGCEPPIVHRDVKTSNILLTANFHVKIADFGLSKSFSSEGQTYISTVIAGTSGYLDPEYQQTKRLSEKSDVYSFGVVLLELVMGKPPLCDGSNKTHFNEVRTIIESGDILDIADRRMLGHYDVDSLRQVVGIALSCTSPSSTMRPNIRHVVAQLKKCLTAESCSEFSSDSTTDTLLRSPYYSVESGVWAAR